LCLNSFIMLGRISAKFNFFCY